MEAETLETDIGTVEEEMNDAEDSIHDTKGGLSEEHRTIVEQLKKIMMEGETSESVMFNKVNKEGLKIQTNRRNEVIKYLKSESITETNSFIRAASM